MFRQLITEFITTGHDVLLVLGPFARIMDSGIVRYGSVDADEFGSA